ncbi:MAG TPA: hypothetical protein VG370_09825 [Chloroflexota bacterium]|jgi:hypothetical protein|nr:hypothetical protein [Chloroflexota bacterium]
MSDARPRRLFGGLRLRFPNTRFGALLVAAILTVAGFGIGVGLIAVVPALRSGPPSRIDPRSRLPQTIRSAAPTSPRPDAWQTPVANASFPENAPEDASGAGGATYEPSQGGPVLALPSILDAIGRPVVAVTVVLDQDDDPLTPAPVRPDRNEPTQLTVVAHPAGELAPSGCTLAFREGRLRAVATLGAATIEECEQGVVRLADGGGLDFWLRYDKLPNRRSRDGAWREGAVFGRTSVWTRLTAAAS